MDGRAHLEKLIADRLRAGRHSPLDLPYVRGVAAGLTAAGALPEPEMHRILADLEHTLQEIGRLRIVTASMSSSDMPLVMPTRAGAPRPEWVTVATNPPLPEPRAVIPLTGQTLGDAALISLEIWTTMVTLRLAHPEPDMMARLTRRPAPQRWHGRDDQGTELHGAGGTGTGADGLYLEEVRLHPAPAPQATTLHLHTETPDGDLHLTIDLGP